VENARGLASLCRLLTRRHTEEGFGLARAVAEETSGLAVLTDHAELLTAWREQGVPVWAALPRRPTGAPLALQRSARKLGAPMVALADACFLEPSDRARHQGLRAIAHNTTLSRLEPSGLAPADAVLAGPDEYAHRFAPLPGEVTQRLEYELGIIAGKGFSSYFLVVEDIVGRSPRICGRGSGAASLVAYSLGITNVCPLKFNLYFERFIHPQRMDPPDIDVDFAWDERDGVIDSVLRQYSGRAAMVATHIFFQGRMAIREVAKVYGLPAAEIKRVMRHLP